MPTPLGQCQFCQSETPKRQSTTCADCAAAIVSRCVAGKESYGSIADSLGVTRGMISGTMSRHGYGKQSPRAQLNSMATRMANKVKRALTLPVSDLYGPPINPREATGCRHITGDPKGDFHYCQEPQLPGKSWCEYHHSLVCVSINEYRIQNKPNYTPKGSARTSEMAHP